MKEFTVTKNDAGQRVDRFAAKAAPSIPSSLLQKTFRKKDVKVNGHWARPDARLAEGDLVRLYIPDEFFAPPEKADGCGWLRTLRPRLDIVYEDGNILLVNKRPGVLCHEGLDWSADTLIAHIQARAYQAGQWAPAKENSFAPALCNRIDRGTGGIVIAAKTAPALRIMDEKIRAREVTKEYLCVCLGTPQPPFGRLEGWLFKDAVKNQVYVKSRPEPGQPGRPEPGGLPAPHRPHPPDPGADGPRGLAPAGGRQVRPGEGQPPLWGDPAVAVVLAGKLRLRVGRGRAELPVWPDLHRGRGPFCGEVFPGRRPVVRRRLRIR